MAGLTAEGTDNKEGYGLNAETAEHAEISELGSPQRTLKA